MRQIQTNRVRGHPPLTPWTFFESQIHSPRPVIHSEPTCSGSLHRKCLSLHHFSSPCSSFNLFQSFSSSTSSHLSFLLIPQNSSCLAQLLPAVGIALLPAVVSHMARALDRAVFFVPLEVAVDPFRPNARPHGFPSVGAVAHFQRRHLSGCDGGDERVAQFSYSPDRGFCHQRVEICSGQA